MLANFLRVLRATFGYFVLFVGAWTIATGPIEIRNDGRVRFTALDTLLRHGTLDHSKYSMYGPIAAAPLWYLGEAVGETEPTVWVFNRVVFLASVAALWVVLRPALPAAERLRFVLLLVFGSTFPWHTTGFFAEPFHVACVGTGLAILATRRGWPAVLGGLLCVWGTANVPATVVGLALAAAVLCVHRRRFRYLLLPAAAAALILIENGVRHGNPFEGGYAGDAGYRTALPYSGLPGFSYPLFFGLLSILFSFGKGLVFFAPGLFAPYPPEGGEGFGPRADARLVYRLWMAVVVGLVLVYARWWAWYGGAVWGPRFFLFAALPAALVLARWTARPETHSTGANALLLLAVALACWVGASGFVYEESGLERYWENDFELEALTWYAPECSALWLAFVEPIPLDWYDRLRFAAFALGFGYLAWPVARVLAVRGWGAVRAGRAAVRDGPRWRF